MNSNAKDKIDSLIANSPSELKMIINEIRQLVLESNPLISEQVKWNSPSFYYTAETKSSNAKEYPRDLMVINLTRGYILLIFPSGSKIEMHDDLLEGNYKDGRRMITIKDYETFLAKKAKLKSAITQWITQIMK
jgi:hypothetical protein